MRTATARRSVTSTAALAVVRRPLAIIRRCLASGAALATTRRSVASPATLAAAQRPFASPATHAAACRLLATATAPATTRRPFAMPAALATIRPPLASARRRLATAATLATALLALTACGTDTEAGTDNTLTVFAAASLTEAFNEIGDRLEAEHEDEHPGIAILFNFAGSSALATQITEGAPGDLFAAADQAAMDTAVDAGAAADPATFALNQLVIAVPEGNPDGVTGLQDLADLSVAVCAEEVPCGSATQAAIAASNTSITPATYEADVKAALAKLALGEVDAALVYRTDAIAADDGVDAVEFPESASAVNAYPIAVLEEARNPDLAAEFIAYIQSDAGQAVLAAAGFQAPGDDR